MALQAIPWGGGGRFQGGIPAHVPIPAAVPRAAARTRLRTQLLCSALLLLPALSGLSPPSPRRILHYIYGEKTLPLQLFANCVPTVFLSLKIHSVLVALGLGCVFVVRQGSRL